MDGLGPAKIGHLFHPANQVLIRRGWRGVRERLACNRGLLHALISSPAEELACLRRRRFPASNGDFHNDNSIWPVDWPTSTSDLHLIPLQSEVAFGINESPKRECMESISKLHRGTSHFNRYTPFLPIILLVSSLLASNRAWTQTAQSISELHRSFADPPDSSRIMMRWWWFGPAATDVEITRELEQMKAAGIGGVEIANLYPLALDDPNSGFHNTPFLSPEHLAALRFAAQEARRLGLRVDVTLCSGWPFGGPHVPVAQSAGKLRVKTSGIPSGSSFALAPHIDTGESLITAFLVPDPVSPAELAHAEPLADPVAGRYTFPAVQQPRKLICFVASRTGMMVKKITCMPSVIRCCLPLATILLMQSSAIA
jgi:hypothetical protein